MLNQWKLLWGLACALLGCGKNHHDMVTDMPVSNTDTAAAEIVVASTLGSNQVGWGAWGLPEDTSVPVDTSPPPHPCEDKTPRIEIGTGELDFEVLEDGAALEIIHGPQGGWHLVGSVQALYLTSPVHIHYEIFNAEGVRVSDSTFYVGLVFPDQCMTYYPGMYGILDISGMDLPSSTTPPDVLAGTSVRLRMEVTDYKNVSVHDEVWVDAWYNFDGE